MIWKVWFTTSTSCHIHIPRGSCRLGWIKHRKHRDVKLADNRIQRECSDGLMHESDPWMLNCQIILTGQNVLKTDLRV